MVRHDHPHPASCARNLCRTYATWNHHVSRRLATRHELAAFGQALQKVPEGLASDEQEHLSACAQAVEHLRLLPWPERLHLALQPMNDAVAALLRRPFLAVI